jgi:hypothetical protein
MNFIEEPSRKLPIRHEVDVLVVGGGPSGVAAALGAARIGAKTMLIERLGSFGGMWTNGLVITLAGFNSWLTPYRRCVKGVTGEWLERAAALDGAEDNRSWVLNSDPEIMKLTADQLITEAGIQPLLHTLMVDVIREENRLRGVVIENVSGRSVILADQIVDCTGNGDVLARSGEAFRISSELQPMTLPFFIHGAQPPADISHEEEALIPIGPEPGLLTDPELSEFASRRHDIPIDTGKLHRAREQGELPTFGGPWFGGLRKDRVWVNTTRVYGSAVEAEDLTRAEIQARKDAHRIMNFYRREFQVFEQAYLGTSSPVIGIRETRRLQGRATLTGEDLRRQTSFPDSIAVGVWPIDVHPSQGEAGVHAMYVPQPYGIPFRCLQTENLENLLVSGRCISTDREAHGSARVGATCGALGHAAGTAAALAARDLISVSELQIDLLRAVLRSQNAVIDPPG